MEFVLLGDIFSSLDLHKILEFGIVYIVLEAANFTHVAVSLPQARSKTSNPPVWLYIFLENIFSTTKLIKLPKSLFL